MLNQAVDAEARLRAKNQLTLPDAIAKALGVEPEDRLIFETDPGQPGLVTVRRVRTDWAGALTGRYGTTEDVKAFLREEHATWDE
jgi:bifunctional DNA-binding transcriptional regulator/antitoxin component of YhaV-PrlF toxin-antitoxin module